MPSKVENALALLVVRDLVTSAMADAYFQDYCYNAGSGISGLGYNEKFARLGSHLQKTSFFNTSVQSMVQAREALQLRVEVGGPPWAIRVEGLGFIFGIK